MAWLLRFLSSLKLAMVVLLGLAALLAGATILESLTDTPTAQYWVYRGWPFKAWLGLLCVNLIAVMVSRWPWQPRHLPFLLAHIGILTLLAGAWVTDRMGIDGSIRVSEGESAAAVELPQMNLVVSERHAEGNTPGFQVIPVPWVPPGARFQAIDVPGLGLRVDEFLPHADPEIRFVAAKAGSPAIRLLLQGGAMGLNQEFWLWAGDPAWSALAMGPARVALLPSDVVAAEEASGKPWPSAEGKNEFAFVLRERGLEYRSVSMRGERVSGLIAHSALRGGSSSEPLAVVDPKWKGVVVKVMEWVPHAENQTRYRPAHTQYGSNAPPSAIRVSAGGQGSGQSVWLGIGDRSVLNASGGREVEVGYFPSRVMLPFSVRLDRFDIGRYSGTADPSTYSSRVTVFMPQAQRDRPAESKEATISMNEPLEVAGITLYQSSYEDADPRPVTSIFSVNRDPGRGLKYLGSLLLVLGTVLLFAVRWRRAKRAAAPGQGVSARAVLTGRVQEVSTP